MRPACKVLAALKKHHICTADAKPQTVTLPTACVVCQAMGGSLAEVEWEGILHWKTWALASLDCCISTTKCAAGELHRRPCCLPHIAVVVLTSLLCVMSQSW